MTAKQFEMVQNYHFFIFERNSLLWGKSFCIYPKMEKYGSMTTGGKSTEELEGHLSTMTDKNVKVNILY